MTAIASPAQPAKAGPAHAHGAAASRAGAASGAAAPADAFAAVLQALAGTDTAGADGGLAPAVGSLASPDAATGESGKDAAKADSAGVAGTPPGAAAQAALPVAIALPAAMLAAAGQAQRGGARGAAPDALSAPAADGAGGPAGHGRPAAAADTAAFARATEPAAATAPPVARADTGAALLAAAASQDKQREPVQARPGADLVPTLAAQAAAIAPQDGGAAAATVPVHQAALPSHPLDASFAGDIAAEVRLMADSGVQQAELHLNPAELGPVRIHLSLTAQTADISFTAAHATTREGLTQSLPALRDLLAGQGLQLGQAGVGAGGQGATARDGWQAPRQDGGRGQAGRATGSVVGMAAAGSAAPTTVVVRRGRGMLDLYA